MPETAKLVEQWRAEFGRDYVNDCIRRGMASIEGVPGEPGYFFAMERGHVIGTPLPANTTPLSPGFEWQRYALVFGTPFAAFLRTPEGMADGSH